MGFFSNLANKRIINDLLRTCDRHEYGSLKGDKPGDKWYRMGIKTSSTEPPKVYMWSSAKDLIEVTPGMVVSCCYYDGIEENLNPKMKCKMLFADGRNLTFWPADGQTIPDELLTDIGLREVTTYFKGKKAVILTYDQAKKKLVYINELK